MNNSKISMSTDIFEVNILKENNRILLLFKYYFDHPIILYIFITCTFVHKHYTKCNGSI